MFLGRREVRFVKVTDFVDRHYLSLFSGLLTVCFALIMTGCPVSKETTEVRFFNDTAVAYEVKLKPVSGGGFVSFNAIGPGNVSERKTIDAGDYTVFTKESTKPDALENWTETRRTYSYGETYTDTITSSGRITD